jgi:hypothetical protein
MLILPPGHELKTSQGPTLSRRERWLIGSVLGLLVVICVAVVIALTSVQRQSRDGCIDVSAATVIGGSELYRCGTAARALCTEPGGAHSSTVSFARALAEACRQSGLPVPAVPRSG